MAGLGHGEFLFVGANATFSIHPTLSFPHCVHVCSVGLFKRDPGWVVSVPEGLTVSWGFLIPGLRIPLLQCAVHPGGVCLPVGGRLFSWGRARGFYFG